MMIDSPAYSPRLDRLSALVSVLAPVARPLDPADPSANLFVLGSSAPEVLVFRIKPGPEFAVIAAAQVTFGARLDQVLRGAPDRIVADLANRPELSALATVFTAETRSLRCGSMPAMARLAETMLILILRSVIDSPAKSPVTTSPGMLAGLAHPRLHLALVAIHDNPSRRWTSEALAEVAGMSRSRFMQIFADIVGVSPGVYMTGWHMQIAQDALRSGNSIKDIARRSGFSSSAAFSRAFSRYFDVSPTASQQRLRRLAPSSS